MFDQRELGIQIALAKGDFHAKAAARSIKRNQV
jgi:hypothetical protein